MHPEDNQDIIPEEAMIDDEPQVFSVTDEDGNESYYAFYDEVEWEGKNYWICLSIPDEDLEDEDMEDEDMEDEDMDDDDDDEDMTEGDADTETLAPPEEMEFFIFQAEEDDEGYVTLYDVDDMEQLQRVADYWESLVAQEENDTQPE